MANIVGYIYLIGYIISLPISFYFAKELDCGTWPHNKHNVGILAVIISSMWPFMFPMWIVFGLGWIVGQVGGKIVKK